MTLKDIMDGLTGQYGVIFLLLFIAISGYKKWWVFGWYAKELLERNDKMERRLDRSVGTAETATGLVKESIDTKLASGRNEVRSE